MRHGVVILPDAPWAVAAERWRQAEALGFDHAWTFDHLAWRAPRGTPWYSALPTLTAAAGVTDRIRLGALVTSANLHHPLTLAKQVMTLDDVSGGRFVCGVGAGAEGHDSAAFGGVPLTPGARSSRFAEFTELLDRLLRQPETTFRGAHYEVHAAAMAPGCVQQPRVPFAIAATGRRGLRLAARYGQIWVTNGRPGTFTEESPQTLAAMLRDQVRRLEDACVAEGRDPASIDRLVLAGSQFGDVLSSPQRFADTRELVAGLGFTDLVVGWPRPGSPFPERPEALDEIAPLLRERTGAAG